MAPAALDPIEGYEFRFYTSDKQEPPHVHVYKNGPKIKFWLGPPVALAEPPGSKALKSVKRQELRRARQLVEENRDVIYAKWQAFFSKA